MELMREDKLRSSSMALSVMNNVRDHHRFAQLVLVVLLCNRLVFGTTNGQQEQSTESTGFNENYNQNSNNDDGENSNNELDRQFDLPGKQLVVNDHDQQRRFDWSEQHQGQHFVSSRQETEKSGPSNHEFISVLNNQSNIIISPTSSSADPMIGISTNYTNRLVPSIRLESDPHLKENLDHLAQNGTRSVNDSQSQSNRTGSEDLYLKRPTPEASGDGLLRAKKLKMRKKKRKKNKLWPTGQRNTDSNLLYLPYLNDTAPSYGWPDIDGAKRMVDYMSSYNATIRNRLQKHPFRQRKPQQLVELMVTSSSQPPDEFATTMILQPPLSQEPIVAAGNEASGLLSDLPAAAPISASSSDDEDGENGDDDDDDDDKGYKSGTKLPTVKKHERNRDQATANSDIGNGTSESGVEKFINTTSPKPGDPPVLAEQELLVGPFRSEAEAPATITLSGIVYHKSGVRSSVPGTGISRPLRASADSSSFESWSKSQLDSENLSTSDSSSHASSSDQSNKLAAKQVSSSVGLPTAERMRIVSGLSSAFGQPTSGSSLGQNSFRFSGINELASKGSLKSGSSRDTLASYHSSSLPLLMNHYYTSQQLLNGAGDPLTSSTSSSGLASQVASLPDDLQQQKQQQTPGWMLADGLESAASGKQSSKGAKAQPLVIVQKDVKPVKYHLMRAYLKLRRLLRPYEATYVFMR